MLHEAKGKNKTDCEIKNIGIKTDYRKGEPDYAKPEY